MMDTYQKHIFNFDAQFKTNALRARNADRLRKIRKPDEIIVVGMGGSGLPGELLLALRRSLKIPVPIAVWKDYSIPKASTRRPLYIFVSFSGNTEETLSGLAELVNKKGVVPALITTGGKMMALGTRKKLPMVTFDADGLTPREALGYTLSGLVLLLRTVFPTINLISPLLHPKRFDIRARALARKLRNRIPVIYTDREHAALGYVWKVNFNETAKHPAFTNVLPEAAHNEIAGFESRKFPFTALFLTDRGNKRILKKSAAFKKVLGSLRVPAFELKLEGKNFSEGMWNSIILSHLTSFHLAELKKVNPSKTKSIDLFKKLTK